MKALSLLTPLIRKEIPDLLRWIAFCPRPCLDRDETRTLTWHLSIDNDWSRAETGDIKNFILNSELRSIQVVFHSLRIPPEESVYLRDIKRSDRCDLPYGSKSGPNKQFFESVNAVLDYRGYSLKEALLLLEVDAIPVKTGWVSLINQALEGKPDFLIAGSRYQGGSHLSPRISQHFNGNAIYGIGSKGFKEFLAGWESLLKALVPVCHWIAYDFCFEWIINAPRGDHGDIIQDHSSALSQYRLSCVDMSDSICNISGKHELSTDTIPERATKGDYVIIHSKPLSKRIDYALARRSLASSILECSHPLIVKQRALAHGPYEYLSSPHPNKFSTEITDILLRNQVHVKNPLVRSMVRSCIRKPSSQHGAQ